jgi:hypothetical protein
MKYNRVTPGIEADGISTVPGARSVFQICNINYTLIGQTITLKG